jgi:hypothetical protein
MSLTDALAGFGAGIVNDTVLYIPDNIKYQQQNNFKARPITLSTIPYHMRGGAPIVFGGGLSYSAYFWSYGFAKQTLDPFILSLTNRRNNDENNTQHSALSKSLLAGLAGALAIIPSTIVSYPFDSLKKHLAVLPDSSPSEVFHQMYQRGGIGAFFFGWHYGIQRDLFMGALKMAFFEGFSKVLIDMRNEPTYPIWLKNESQNSPGHNNHSNEKSTHTSKSNIEASNLSSREVAGVGLVAGTLTGVVSTPIDCVVSRIRSPITPQEQKKSFLTCARWMMSQEPNHIIRPFTRGIAIRTLNYAVGSTIFWTLFAGLQKQLDSGLNSNNGDGGSFRGNKTD